MSLIHPVLGLPLAEIFLGYVGVIAALLAVVLLRKLPFGRALIGIGFIAVWLAYGGILGYRGILADPNRVPPGIVLLVAPFVTFGVLVLGRSPVGRYLATSLPLALILGLQTFRIGVELTLSELAHAGLTPRLLTLSGGNIEILIAFTAPLIAWIATRGDRGRRIALVWNVIGLLSLLNVSTRAVLTTPGPANLIHAEVPNLAMGMFPFSYIPGFMAPLAMMLHVLAFRALRAASAPAASNSATALAWPPEREAYQPTIPPGEAR